MKRIDTPTVEPDLFGLGKDGFQELDPNDPGATQLDDKWFNGAQEELVQTIERTEQTPAFDVNIERTFTQLYRGLRKMWVTLMSLFGDGAFILGDNLAYVVGGGSLNADASPFDIVVDGRRLEVSAADLLEVGEDSHLFTASKDTFVYVDPIGDIPTLAFKAVDIGFGDPGADPGFTAILRVRTDATEVTELEDLIDTLARASKRFDFLQGLKARSTADYPAAHLVSDEFTLTPLWVIADGDTIGPAALISHPGGENAITAFATGGSTYALDATGGAAGVRGTPLVAANPGMHGRSHASGTTAGSGVYAEGLGDAVALRGVADDGYAAHLGTSGNRAPIHMETTVTDPVITADGDVWYNSARDQYRGKAGSANVALWASPGGKLEGGHTNAADDLLDLDPLWAIVATVSLSGENTVAQASVKVHFHVSATVKQPAGAVNRYRFRIYDSTSAIVVWMSEWYDASVDTGKVEPAFGYITRHTISLAGDRTFELQGQSFSGGNEVNLLDASMLITGTY